MPQTLIELNGDARAPVLNMMPANGFPAQSYLPMLRRLADFRALSLPPRALWGDQAAPTRFGSWRDTADDCCAGSTASICVTSSRSGIQWVACSRCWR